MGCGYLFAKIPSRSLVPVLTGTLLFAEFLLACLVGTRCLVS